MEMPFVLSAVERTLYQMESKLGLGEVPFLDYESAIKRYGYRGHLKENVLKAIASEINLDSNKLDDSYSVQY